MPSPAFADDDTALRCSGPSDWNPRIWDWVVENDVDEAGRIYHDEKPRIRGRHRDSKRHGARGVDAYSETITVFDVQQTSWYSRGTNAPVFLRNLRPMCSIHLLQVFQESDGQTPPAVMLIR